MYRRLLVGSLRLGRSSLGDESMSFLEQFLGSASNALSINTKILLGNAIIVFRKALSEDWLSGRDRAILEKLIEEIEDYLESALGL